MNAKELKEFFVKQFTNGEVYIELSKGKAKYKMKRGSFKTKDLIASRHHLVFQSQFNNEYLFADSTVSCRVNLDDSENIKIHFEADSEYNRFKIRFKTFDDEHIYGCGEQYTHFDLKGQKVDIWVSEHQQVMKIVKKFLREKIKGVNPDYQAPYKDHQTYYSSPGFMSSRNYFIYCHEDSYGQIEFKKGEVIIKFRQVPTSISILTGDSPIDLSKKITNLIGIQPKLPDFVNSGAILGIQGGTEEVLKKYQSVKDKGGKVSAIWCQDWSGQIVTEFGTQVYWNWKLDEKLYHDFPKLIETLNKDNVKFLGYINTFVKQNSEQFNYAKDKGFLVKRRNGKPYLIQSTTFNAGIVDLTNPGAYSWYKEIIKKNMIGIGLSGWMADFGEYLPTDSIVYGGKAEKLHNKWPTLWAKCNYDAIKECGKEGQVFFFSRAAYGHTIQFTNSMWSGDQHVDYSDEYGLGSVIPSMLSSSCSGVGIIHSDVGGYTTILHMKRDAELFKRWSQMNVFTPVYRTHEGNRPKSNVQFDSPSVIDSFASDTLLFSKLKPYREEVEEEYYSQGIPAIRPLFFHYVEEECFVNQKEFMFGRDLLVVPVIRKNQADYKCYLPKDNWARLGDNSSWSSGNDQADVSNNKYLVFYRKDSKFAELFKSIKF